MAGPHTENLPVEGEVQTETHIEGTATNAEGETVTWQLDQEQWQSLAERVANLEKQNSSASSPTPDQTESELEPEPEPEPVDLEIVPPKPSETKAAVAEEKKRRGRQLKWRLKKRR